MGASGDWGDGLPFLHIYPQCSWHQDAEIVGTAEGLRALAEALIRAAETGSSSSEALCRDGEGYRVVVRRTNTAGMSYTRLPYIGEIACETPHGYAEKLRRELEEALEALDAR